MLKIRQNEQSGRVTRPRLLLASLLLCIGVVGLTGPGSVSAHASVAATSPGDGEVLQERPDAVTIEFNEKVATADGSVRLVDADGKSTDLLETSRTDKGAGVTVAWQIPEDLEQGWHAVAWRAVSEDGHPINGSFTFYYGDPEDASGAAKAEKVKDPTRPFVLLSDVLRALTYIAVLSAIGLFAAGWAFSGPLLSAAVPGAVAATRKWSTVMTIAALVLTPAALVNNSVILNGGSTESLGVIIQIVLQSSAGTALLVRMSALFGICTALLLVAEKGTRKAGNVIAVASAAALAYSFPMAGHAAVVPWSLVAEISETLHLLAGAAWLGAIPAVAFLLLRRRDITGEAALEAVSRFSKVATVSVILVLVGGVSTSVTMFTEPGDIVLTRYGVTLVVKFLLVSTIALAGAYNHFYLLPRLRNSDNREEARSHLRLSLIAESVGLLLVAIATSALTMVSSPAAGGNHLAGGHGHGGFGDSFELEAALGDLEPRILRAVVGNGEARLDYLPGRADAENRFTLTVTDASGDERELERVSVKFVHEELGIGPIERPFLFENGSWLLSTRDLGVAGEWTAEVTLAFENQEMDIVTFNVTIDPARGQP